MAVVAVAAVVAAAALPAVVARAPFGENVAVPSFSSKLRHRSDRGNPALSAWCCRPLECELRDRNQIHRLDYGIGRRKDGAMRP